MVDRFEEAGNLLRRRLQGIALFLFLFFCAAVFFRTSSYFTTHVMYPTDTFYMESVPAGPDFLTAAVTVMFMPLLFFVYAKIYFRVVRGRLHPVKIMLHLKVVRSVSFGIVGFVVLLCWLNHTLCFVCYTSREILLHPTMIASSQSHEWKRVRRVHASCHVVGEAKMVFYHLVFDDDVRYRLYVGSSEQMLLAVSKALKKANYEFLTDASVTAANCPPLLYPILSQPQGVRT